MNKKIITAFMISAVTAVSVSAFPMGALAATVDEVADVARSYGIPEEDIQAGYNEYYAHPEAYPPEKLDQAISKLHETGGIIITTGEYIPSAEPVVTVPTETTESGSTVSESNDDYVSLKADDGSTFTRISAESFIKMSYDEKMAYISSFPQDKQQVIINNLTPAEYKSLIKQSPSEKKMEIIHSLSGAADEMGLVVTVDEVSDDSLTVSMRNDEGKLVNVSSAGATVEDTGYDRRGIIASAAAALSVAVAALILLCRKYFGQSETE